MRLFFAIELSTPVRQSLSRLMESLKAQSIAPVAWVRPENLHLTLKFLGEVPEGAVPAICQSVQILSSIGEMRLVPDAPELFPHTGRVRIIAIGLGGDMKRLHQAVEGIESVCFAQGLARENRPFRAHITLARARRPLPAARIKITDAISPHLPAPDLVVRSISLMQSHLQQGHATYSTVARFPVA